MAYLLDSDWLILRLADRPSAVRLVRQLAPVGLAVSVITYMEVFQGIDREPDPAAAEVRLGHLLTVMTVLPISQQVARRCAFLRRALRQQGRRIGPRALDLLVAATSIEHDLTLVTRNFDDYRDVPDLRLFPPIDLV